MNTRILDNILLALVIAGAVNWGLIGFFNFNLVAALFGSTWISRVIYALVGLSGLYCLTMYGKIAAADTDLYHQS